MAGLFDALVTGAQTGLSHAVGPIRVRTNLNADSPVVLTIPDPNNPPPPAPPSPLMSLLKPEVTVDSVGGEMSWAPWGRPSANYTPLILAGVGLIGFTLVGIGGIMGRFVRPRTIAIAGITGSGILAFIAGQTQFEQAEESGGPV